MVFSYRFNGEKKRTENSQESHQKEHGNFPNVSINQIIANEAFKMQKETFLHLYFHHCKIIENLSKSRLNDLSEDSRIFFALMQYASKSTLGNWLKSTRITLYSFGSEFYPKYGEPKEKTQA